MKKLFRGILFWYPFEQTCLGVKYIKQTVANNDNFKKMTAQLAHES